MKFFLKCALKGLRNELKEEVERIDIHMEVSKTGVIEKVTKKIDLLFDKVLEEV